MGNLLAKEPITSSPSPPTPERIGLSSSPHHRPQSGQPTGLTAGSRRKAEKKQGGYRILFGIIIIFGLAAWQARSGPYYTTRSPLGFYLGVAGSLMMLSALLGYPLRKRMRFMQRWGALKKWFRFHMFLGLAGPTCILFHSTFHVRSINAGVALFSMLLVVASGIIGRFIYAKIHMGLYGRRANMKQLQEELGHSSEETRSCLALSPQLEPWLNQFKERALRLNLPFPENTLNLITLGFFRIWIAYHCRTELARTVKLSSPTPEQASFLISIYLKEIQRVAQFTMYERIFSLWHILHIPLIYLLAASGVFHVIAVYMY